MMQLKSYDIICLQETHSTPENIKFWTGNFPLDRCFFSHGEANARGALIVLDERINFKIIEMNGHQTLTDRDGRIVAICYLLFLFVLWHHEPGD